MFDASYRVLIGIRGPYGHTFGHDAELQGLASDVGDKPAHLVVSLDMADPRLSFLGVHIGSTLRLVHPYFFSQGQTFAYRHAPNRIEFSKPLSTHRLDDSWPSKDYPTSFSSMPVDLVADAPDAAEWNIDKIYISKSQPTLQNESWRKCEACALDRLTLIAVVPSTPLPDLDLWGESGRGVTTNFWYCADCYSVNTSNSSD